VGRRYQAKGAFVESLIVVDLQLNDCGVDGRAPFEAQSALVATGPQWLAWQRANALRCGCDELKV